MLAVFGLAVSNIAALLTQGGIAMKHLLASEIHGVTPWWKDHFAQEAHQDRT